MGEEMTLGTGKEDIRGHSACPERVPVGLEVVDDGLDELNAKVGELHGEVLKSEGVEGVPSGE
jgi:hypothetical protein